MASYITHTLIFIACAIMLVSACFAAPLQNTDTNIHIGVFNSKNNAQDFFKSLPAQITNKISQNQLWLNVYKNYRGFSEHYIHIADFALDDATELCENIASRGVQCITSASQRLFDTHPLTQNPQPSYTQVSKIDPQNQNRELAPPMGMRLAKPGQENAEALEVSYAHAASVNTALSQNHSLQNHAEDFVFYSRTQDTMETKAVKAAYETARNKFISSLQQIGTSMNAGNGTEKAKQELIALGREAFRAAGRAYLSEYLAKRFGDADMMSNAAESTPDFIENIKQNLAQNAQSTVEGLISQALLENADHETLPHMTDTIMLAGARSIIDAGLSSAKRSDLYALRHIELEYNLSNLEDAYFSTLLTQPIYQSSHLRHNIFLQGGGTLNEQSVDVADDVSRHTLNLGAAYRYLSVDEKLLLGGNIFFDHQWPYNHSRLSIGLDAKSKYLNVATNYYHPLSGYKDGRVDTNGIQYEERALKGIDLEIGYQPPFVNGLSVFGKGYQYFRETDEDIQGIELSAEYSLNDHFTVKGAFIEENGGRDGTELSLQYRMPLYDTDKMNLALADLEPAAGSLSVRNKIFDKVRRNNTIRVEERVKNTETNLTAQFSTFSTNLPYDVGGAPTGSGSDLPYDTTITIPNGEFGIISFSNGAIANISASGGGAVTLQFNDTTLSVLATNGGFLQYISGSGGISVINVPGGTVTLLGTDIDVTDDATTTTIQTRAGSISITADANTAVESGAQSDIVALTIASGAMSKLSGAALETRQENAFTSLDSQNPDPPDEAKAAPFIKAAPSLGTGPQLSGDNADIEINFSQAVSVSGTPTLSGFVDANARTFTYNAAASAPTKLVFRYTFIAADAGASGVTINSLDLNGGTITGSTNGLNALTAFTDTVLAITDQGAPTLASSTPADDVTTFAAGADIILNFNENIQANIGNIILTDTTDGSDSRIIPITDAQVNIAGSTLTLSPSSSLDLLNAYDLTIGANVIQDTSGNAFAGISTGDLNFVTANDTTPPTLTSSSPSDNSIDIARDDNIVLTFDESIILSGTINVVDTDDATGNVSYTSASAEVSVSGNTITINPANDLEYAENYEVTWSAGAIEDLFGNAVTTALNSGDLNFKTIDLERTLILTGTATGVDGNIDETDVQGNGYSYAISSNAVYAANITVPAAPNGVIWECGATGNGAWIGFHNADGFLRMRAGDGAALPQNDTALIEISIGNIAAGDYTLTWDFNVSTGTIRVWLDETLLGSDSSASGDFNNMQWAGTDNCGYGSSNSNVPTGELSTDYTVSGGILNSTLRYYSNQVIP